jgi:hypothetical protein
MEITAYGKFALVDVSFTLQERQFYLFNESTLREFQHPCLDVLASSSPSRSQTFHILTDPNVLQFAREHYSGQISFNEFNFHRIPADYGGISYSGFCKQFNREALKYQAIFTKGTQKVTAIKDVLSGLPVQVYNLETFFCPPISDLAIHFSSVRQTSCIFHASAFQHCTAYKVELYASWLKQNYAKMNAFWGSLSHIATMATSSSALLTPDYFLYTQVSPQQEQAPGPSAVQWHTPSAFP